MLPEIDVLGLSLKTFGLCFGLAFVVSGAIVTRRLKELDQPPDWAYEMVFAALLGGLLGARGYWLLGHLDALSDDPLGAIVGGAGLVWYGGALGGAVAMLLWARRRDMINLGLLDLCAPALAMGYAVGRIGCQISGDGDYGTATDLPWGMAYPDGVVPTTEVVHPTPVYETLVMGLGAWALWRGRDALRPGVLFACYLVLAGSERLLVEFVRRNDPVLAGLTEAQLASLVMLVAGIVWLVRAARTGGLRLPAETPAPAPARAATA
jgi:phosphatidylglycerol:prolipoprotein diacylglycerol transferase